MEPGLLLFRYSVNVYLILECLTSQWYVNCISTDMASHIILIFCYCSHFSPLFNRSSEAKVSQSHIRCSICCIHKFKFVINMLLLQNYHPTRVLTLSYQPFAFGITLILTFYEAKMNTRLRNLAGFSLFFLGSFALIIVSTLPSQH